ncbi:hypothetical protein Fmac_020411 [Flemingia macrophylla]|uniref:Uncharacterized protein n=1 Tax=Flemingia macrophylla TaxID=520843 RepID=A0ABD1LU07_9FABA
MRLTELLPPSSTPTTLILALSRVENERHMRGMKQHRRGWAHVLVAWLSEMSLLRRKKEEEVVSTLWRIAMGFVRIAEIQSFGGFFKDLDKQKAKLGGVDKCQKVPIFYYKI